jgi:hypothetical protein
MKPLALLAAISLLVLAVATPARSTGRKICCPGESRCTPQGAIERCAAPGGDRWTYEIENCKYPVASTGHTYCNDGDTRCGADGRVEQCRIDGAGSSEESTVWHRTNRKCGYARP